MTAEQAIESIHSFIRKGAEPGLHRERELLERIGNPQRSLKFIHIAGTNGKGSTAAMTASILTRAGYRTGLFTSPFVYRFQERMQVDGVQIRDEDLAEVTQAVLPHAQAMAEKPTEFELVCAIAYAYFLRQRCDLVVLEAGMGGAVDATNAIETPEVAVITNIGLDHTEFLGDTLEKIAENKAGIFKEGGSAVIYRGTPGVEAVLEGICRARKVSLKKADFQGLRLESRSLEGQIFDCGTREKLFLPLLGDHQLHNAAVVLAIMDTLIGKGWRVSEQHIRDGLRQVVWPGRFDIVCRDPLFIIDGGHNPQCIEALVKNVEDYLAGRRIIVLTGVLADKDYVDMFRPVMPYAERFVCITPPTPRKLEAETLAGYLRQAGADAIGCETIAEGVRTAKRLAGQDGVVLCFGSLYSIGAIRDALEPAQSGSSAEWL
ncbi:MAG: bifunctional folylpolyglutamate synthase/dihydrofolate synthase [Faecousia sp.]